jgi:DNA-binding NtrC family response regulator
MCDLPPDLLSDFGVCPPPRTAQAGNGANVNHPGATLPEMLANNELRLITLTLQEQRWNITRSAHVLGIARATLYEKLKKYGITRSSCTRQMSSD